MSQDWEITVVLAVVLVFSHQLLSSQVSGAGQIAYLFSPWSAIAAPKIENDVLSDVIFSVYPNRHFINTFTKSFSYTNM